MFRLESEMTAPAIEWLTSQGMHWRREFATPWGPCDLVAMSFDPVALEQRRRNRQYKAIASSRRAGLIFGAAYAETSEPSVALSREHQAWRDEWLQAIADSHNPDIARLIADGWVIRNESGQVTRRQPWLPLHARLVAVELKLSRVKDALRQASRHLVFATESYAAFPMTVAERVREKRERWAEYFARGVGVLGIAPGHSAILIPSQSDPMRLWLEMRWYAPELFWRDRPRLKAV